MGARVQRQPTEQLARAPARGRVERLTVQLEGQVAEHVDAQHRESLSLNPPPDRRLTAPLTVGSQWPCTMARIPTAGETMSAIAETQSQPFADQLFERYIAAMEVLEVHIGDRLGLYEALADRGALNSRALAAATDTHERYAREWLEAQAAGGHPRVENPMPTPSSDASRSPPSTPRCSRRDDSLDYMAPIARIIAATTQALPQVLDAFRSGAACPGRRTVRTGARPRSDQNRALFLSQLGSEWLPSIDDVHARLAREAAWRTWPAGRLVEHRHRACLPRRAGRRLRPGRGFRRARPRERGRVRRGRSRPFPRGRRRRPAPGRRLRPGHDLRGAARRGASRGAAPDASAAGRRHRRRTGHGRARGGCVLGARRATSSG